MNPPKIIPVDSVEFVETITVIQPIPAELLRTYDNPPIPYSGLNRDLLNWASACKINNEAYYDQTMLLKELK